MPRLCLLISLLWIGCKPVQAPMTESVVKTDETKASIQEACDQFLPEDTRDEWIANLCSCLKTSPRKGAASLNRELCEQQDLLRYMRGQRMMMVRESGESMTASDGTKPTSEEMNCTRNLADFHVELALQLMAEDCEDERVSDEEFRSLLTLPETVNPSQCWTLTRMTPEACILARPCVGSGPSDPAILPLAPESGVATWGMIDEGQTVTLCKDTLRDIHMLKDPDNVNINYNYAFANLLTHGRTAARQTFGPANCHGTAQAMMGGFLDAFKATEITYHSTVIQQECESKAKEVFAMAAQKSGGEFPTARDLPVERGGYLINMNHQDSCDPDECGTVSLAINACEDELLAHVFFSDMCIHCWDKTLQNAGLQRLPENATWQDLIPGCVLTAADHSVTMIFANNGMCYYYEATSPFGPPQLRVRACNAFYHHFPKRWCPMQPIQFVGRK